MSLSSLYYTIYLKSKFEQLFFLPPALPNVLRDHPSIKWPQNLTTRACWEIRLNIPRQEAAQAVKSLEILLKTLALALVQSFVRRKKPPSKTSPTDQTKTAEPMKPVEGKSQRASIRRWAFRSWIWELSACICSLLAFFSIFAVLKYYDGRPQLEWPNNITVNSVLSWATTVLRAARLVSVTACISQASWLHFRVEARSLIDLVRYDAASRGPVGSVNLLWMLKARQWHSSMYLKPG